MSSTEKFVFRICLNELIKSLETYRALDQNSIIREESEEAMIVARANVADSKKEFLVVEFSRVFSYFTTLKIVISVMLRRI